MVDFIIRQFAGKIAAAVASLILIAVTQGLALLAAKVPEIAALCNPQAVATWLDTFVIAVLNIMANKYHIDAATAKTVEDAIAEASPTVVVKEPVNPAK